MPAPPNWQLRRMLGCSRNTVKSAIRIAGLIGVSRFGDLELKPDRDVRQQIERFRKAENGYLQSVFLNGNSEEMTRYDQNMSPELISDFLAQGTEVTVRFQLPNLLKVRDSDKAPKQPGDKKDTTDETTSATSKKRMTTVPVGPSFDTAWVDGQLRLGLDKLGWAHGDSYINPDTGQVIERQASSVELLDFMCGGSIS